MDTNYKDPTQVNIHAWANEWYTLDEKKRSLIIISSEPVDGDESSNARFSMKGKTTVIVKSILAAMRKSEDFAGIVYLALKKYIAEPEKNNNDD